MRERMWEREESKSGQLDYIYPICDKYDLVISQRSSISSYAWQIVGCDEPTLMSIDVFGNDGYFATFADAFSSLVDYLWDNYTKKIPESEISSIPYLSGSVEAAMISGTLSAAEELNGMNSTTFGGIMRLLI